MARISRRKLLKLSGAGTLAARAGGIAAILASGRAPAYADLLRKQIVPECEKALGIKLTVETINGNDIQARTTAGIQSGSGPDVICALNNWPQLYAESVVDVSDIAEEIGKAQGGFYDTAKAIAYDGKKWLAVPNTIIGLQIANRTSWWNEIGYGPEKYPETWEDWREAGKKLKAKG